MVLKKQIQLPLRSQEVENEWFEGQEFEIGLTLQRVTDGSTFVVVISPVWGNDKE